MKILLAATTVYYPSFGGAGKANRAIAEQLAARGHTVRAMGPALSHAGFTAISDFRRALQKEGIVPQIEHDVDVFERHGVRVYAPAGMQNLLSEYRRQLDDFDPDCLLLTTEDWQMGLLEIALDKESAAVALLVHGAISLPFGPAAMRPNAWGEKMMSRAGAIIAPSRFIKDYIRTHSALDSTLIHLPAYPPPPYRHLGGFGNQYVTILNPSAGKGIDVFLEMARRLPDVQFAAVPTWATTEAERGALVRHPNVIILNRTVNIEEVWARTRIAMMPSTWPEAFPLTPVEAMLHGIPVLASNGGGTPEAMLGADFVLPVQSMTGYAQTGNPFLPSPVVPPQRLEEMQQWEAALRLLTSEPSAYDFHSQAAREAAVQFVSGLSVEPVERLLVRIAEQKRPGQRPTHSTRPAPDLSQKIARLTPEQRAVLQTWLQSERGRFRSEAPNLADEPAVSPPPASSPAPLSDTEITVARIWSDLLGKQAIDIHANLFELDSHALIAAEVIQQLRRTVAPGFPLHALFEHPTIAGVAATLQTTTTSYSPHGSEYRHLIPLRVSGSRPPIFFVSGGGGSENEYMTAYAGLIHALGPAQPLYGFQAQTRDGLELPFQTVEAMASVFVDELRSLQSHGPYFVLAECLGAKVGLEVARLLLEQGEAIGLLLFLNGETTGPKPGLAAPRRAQNTIIDRLQKLRQVPSGQRLARMELMARNTAVTFLPLTEEQRNSQARRAAKKGYIALLGKHELRPYSGDVTVLMTPDIQARGEPGAWARLVQGRLTFKTMTGVHRNYLGEHLGANVKVIEEAVVAAQQQVAPR